MNTLDRTISEITRTLTEVRGIRDSIRADGLDVSSLSAQIVNLERALGFAVLVKRHLLLALGSGVVTEER